MRDQELKALLYPFESGLVPYPEGPVIFLNGQYCKQLSADTVIQQYFKPMAENAVSQIPDSKFNGAIILTSKNKIETQYYIGKALEIVNENGLILCAGDNTSGGRRLKKDLQTCGLTVETLSKFKCQIVWSYKPDQIAEDWVKNGEMQQVLNGQFLSQPGIFGWDKVDEGSEMLATIINDHALKGVGADFGCGYGYLARNILDHQEKVTGIYCLDADIRAVNVCKVNLGNSDKVKSVWSDLTKPQDNIPALDWIVMNPPFHQGKEAQYSIGTDFIKTAAGALNDQGCLWMVANAHLPYETVLNVCFHEVKKLDEKKGFKVFYACRKRHY